MKKILMVFLAVLSAALVVAAVRGIFFKDFHGSNSRSIDNIVIVEQDDYSYEHMGRVMPGPEWRQFHARLINNLEEAGAKVIAFDYSFETDSPYDKEFFSAVRKWDSEKKNVLVGALTKQPSFAQGYCGHCRVEISDHDYYVNLAAVLASKEYTRALSWVAVLNYLRDRQLSVEQDLVFGGRKLRTSMKIRNKAKPDASLELERVPIELVGPNRTFKRYSYYDVWGAENGSMLKDGVRRDLRALFGGKIVLVGGSYKDPRTGRHVDRHETKQGIMDGVELQANAINTILRKLKQAGLIDSKIN